ncbi:MAG: tRNA1(Val) (adenine(37)-N6)-methyltransferase [Acutalibacteraceae bacterium]
MTLSADERLEPLGKNMNIVVSDAHTFGTDAVLLSDFAGIKRSDIACDLGTGCGIIPLLWLKKETNKVFAVEIQQKACRQLEKTLKLCGLENRLEVINADLRSLKGVLPLGEFDLVTMNPPYKPVGTGIESASESDKIARHETMCTVEDAVCAASKLLRWGGRFCLCHRPERLCDIIVAMRKFGVEAKRIRFVCEKEGRAPWLVLVDGRRGGKPGVTIEKNLLMKNSDGTESDEIAGIFEDYRQSRKEK